MNHDLPLAKALWGGFRHAKLDSYDKYRAWWPETGEPLKAEEWALARCMATGRPFLDQVVDIETFDHQRKTIVTSAVPLREGDQLSGGVAVAQDITARIGTERALAQRTADLERSNSDLEQFAYIASHDLQEPLRMVASFTQLLQRRYQDKLDADADEYIGFVVSGALRMQQLLNDLLEYSRVGTRGRALQPISANDALADALANLRIAIQECRGEVAAERLPIVMADRAQLAQVFQNLIGNALKFAAEGRAPRVTVSGARGNGDVAISVEDNGIGIEPRHADRIFLIFQRLDRSGKYPGTGLGLAICKRIVTRHGGTITVTSTPGAGSRFTFTLQAAESPPHVPVESIA